MPSTRAELLTRRTYCRPVDEGHESWEDVVHRVIEHQTFLWGRALGSPLNNYEWTELDELKTLMLERKALPSGRILWMGGTPQARKTEIAMFNCCFHEVRDVFTAVDAFYLLLNGCGVGFKPVSGLLNGFATPVLTEVIRSTRKDKGNPDNRDEIYVASDGTKTWHLTVGDSGKAWAKAFGKILAFKGCVDRVVLDFTEIRPAGQTISGYGWMSSGDEDIAKALEQICTIMSRKADSLLDEIDILDIINLVGTTLSSRRAAQIAMLHAHHRLAESFADAKRDHWKDSPWRSQSNNTLVFWSRPTKLELRGIFQQMLDAGGSEPGLYNGEAAKKRAPWFTGTNPCGEILLPDGGLCNLVEVDIAKFEYLSDLERAVYLIARANYRQTCVQLKDEVLSEKWHETNEFLRLCGVGLTGIVRKLDELAYPQQELWLNSAKMAAKAGAHSMAQELGLPSPKAVTTVKPSGTLGKIMDTTEGLHRPLGRYILNNVKFDAHDPLVEELITAGYEHMSDPYGGSDIIVSIPVDNGPGKWQWAGGAEVNLEPAVEQLERYALVMREYVDHNASVTINYSPDEIPAIVAWLHENWDNYVGVSFILRTDPSKTAEDLGYPYLPQEVITERQFSEYTASLSPITIEGGDMLETDECAGGACPVR